MRTTLLIAGLAGLLVTAVLPAAAAGPGRDDIDAMNQKRTIAIGDNGRNREAESRWTRGYAGPWPSPYGYGYPTRGRDGHDQGYYGYPRPAWSYDGRGAYGRPAPLPEDVVRYRLRYQYFRDLRRWEFVNGYYRAYAKDRYGRDVRLIVDPYTGRVLDVRRRD